MNKEERSCWSQKELEQIQANLRRQQIPRERVDIVPCCFQCSQRHGKSERKIITEEGRFVCAEQFFKRMKARRSHLTRQEFEARLVPYQYGQAVYPLARYREQEEPPAVPAGKDGRESNP